MVIYATSISDVVRKPMIDYINKNIPVYVDKEIDSIKSEALAKIDIKDKAELLRAKEQIEKPLDSIKNAYLNMKNEIKANPKGIEAQKLKAIIENTYNDFGNPTNQAQKFVESRLGNLSKNIDSILLDFAEKDGVFANLSKMVKSYIDPIHMSRDEAIMSFMLLIATFIVIFCKVDSSKLLEASTFKAGMAACVCVLGVAWLGNTFVEAYKVEIGELAGKLVNPETGGYPALLAVALFFASMLLYSQAATAKAIMPVVISALGITSTNSDSAYIIVASFAAVSALFVLPTYPTLLGAVQMDDTGSTRIGRFVFNHSFIFPGIIAIIIAVALGFAVTPLFV